MKVSWETISILRDLGDLEVHRLFDLTQCRNYGGLAAIWTYGIFYPV